MTEKLLAKPDETKLLIEHLKDVSKCAAELATNLGLSEDLVEVARIAGLLHDIGKAEPKFQEIMKRKIKEKSKNIDESDAEVECYEQKNEKDRNPLHNEIGWAFLCRKGFSYGKNAQDNYADLITNATYWHHGYLNFNHHKNYKTIVKILENIDTKVIDSFASEIVKDEWFMSSNSKNNAPIPAYINGCPNPEKYNALLFIIRSCVVYADRIVSANDYEKKEMISFGIDSMRNAIKCPEDYDIPRFNKCIEIAEEALKHRITQINAVAGFGKTIIGLLSHLIKGGHTFWVVPRNAIAESVYKGLETEIKALNLKVGIELLLGGTILYKSSENPSITITNIDNLVSPITTMKNAGSAYHIFKSNVIFDEYHEFAQKENGIYSAFLNVMIARGGYSKSNTILLSATPSVHSEIWDDIISNCFENCEQTHIMPDKNKFYKAMHSIEYNIENGEYKGEADSLIIKNSVKTAQKTWEANKKANLIHNRFTEEHKDKIMKKFLETKGKNEYHDKSIWIASPIVQASMDVSFEQLFETIMSPENTMQRIGRCCRWGQEASPKIVIVKDDSQSNKKAIESIYDMKLNEKWDSFFQEHFMGHKTLDCMYELYSEFNEKYKNELKLFYKKLFEESTEALSKLVPLRYHKKKTDKEAIYASKRATLRSLRPNYFITARIGTTNEWLSTPLMLREQEMKELWKASKEQDNLLRKPILKQLRKAGYKFGEGNTRLKKWWDKQSQSVLTLHEALKNNCNCGETPYPPASLRYYYADGDQRGVVEE